MTVGGIVAATWPTFNPYITTIPIVPLVPGFFLNLFTIFLVSKLTGEEDTVSAPNVKILKNLLTCKIVI